MPETTHPRFFTELAQIINAGLSRSVILAGEVHDLCYSKKAGDGDGAYVPLVSYLSDACSVPGLIVLVYEINGPIRVVDYAAKDRDTRQTPGHALSRWDKIKSAWINWKLGTDPDELILQSLTDRKTQRQRETIEAEFDRNVMDVVGQPTFAFEFLRQLTHCSRSTNASGKPFLADHLMIIVESADMLLPVGRGDIASLSYPDRHRIAITQDWFSDPGFTSGPDSVVLLAESASQIHPRIAQLPSLLSVTVDPPDTQDRQRFIERFMAGTDAPRQRPSVEPELPDDEAHAESQRVQLWAGPEALARAAAGMSLHALRQLLLGAAHRGQTVRPDDVIDHVERFLGQQLGEDVIEFKRPTHRLTDVVGASGLKQFLHDELIPRFRSSGADALPGAAVAGPIGGGKTFIFEAMAAELDLPVLVLKNIRSQWFGQTDVIFERLRRVLSSLEKVVIFVDEADTQFGGVGPDAHATERRLTGKVQAMMSDPALRGKVIWLLMTARIHMLSPDIRRPGRVGDLIIPVLDAPRGSDDRRAFLRWMLSPALGDTIDDAVIDRMGESISASSAAAFAALRSRLKGEAARAKQPLDADAVERIAHDQLPPAIGEVRRYQTLQALINCTRRSLLPDPETTDTQRLQWMQEIHSLEAKGIRLAGEPDIFCLANFR